MNMDITTRRKKCVYIFIIISWSELVMSGTNGFSDFQFLVEPHDTIVIKDHSTILNCSAAGNPSPVIGWKKDGALLELLQDDRRSILANGSLLFQRVLHSRTQRPDEGVYQCTAFLDGIGSIISREAKLQIASLPPFDKNPHNNSILEGQTAYFPCSIQGIPPATISWLRNEQILRLDQTRMTVFPSGALEIVSVSHSDEGMYRCVAVNADKSRESGAGALIVNTDYNELNRLSPHFIAKPPNTTVVTRGSHLTLDCAANGIPQPRITWLKDGTTVDLADLDSRYRIVGSGSLYIENVIEEDTGIYMCRAENAEDSVDTSAIVDILVPPYFVKRPENRYAYEKEDITLECEVYGKPVPILQWFKNGTSIIPSEYFQITSGNNLKIFGLVKSDSGIYQCFAKNSAGSIQASAQLVVFPSESSESSTSFPVTSPHFLKIPGQLQYHKDAPSAPLNVSAVIISTRFITLSWQQPMQRNGDIIAYSVYYREEKSNRERVHNVSGLRMGDLNIQGLLPATKYIFSVVAYNHHGPGESSKELVVQTEPDVHVPNFPSSLLAVPISATSVLVKWKPPEVIKEPIEHYKVSYIDTSTSEEHSVITKNMSLELHNLKKFTKYIFWVTAFNKNGPGSNSDEVAIHTYADVPTETPQNVTLEPASSTSIIIRWEPPPKEFRNGIITGYKIRYKQKNGKRAETLTTDGNRRLYALVDLEKGAQYMVRIAALSVNGSGPYTEWKTVETYYNDLEELKVPGKPSALRARPSSDSIFVSWGPPHDQNIVVRGYKIGWGVGVADVYFVYLDGEQRHFKLENLQPSSEYVISVRAHNHVGEGVPAYETVKTHIEITPEPSAAMLPPVGLKAIVLSSSTVVLYWTDTTLSRNQLVTDNRYYVVRYAPYTYSSMPRYHTRNFTDLNCMLDDLFPNTQYEFAVKVIKGRRESTWSMSVINTTQEAAPSSPPRDLTVVASEDDSSQVNLHWQPPKQPNGHITGYVIFYTTDKTQRDRDWVVEGVVGDKMTTVLKGLTLDTTYYFKIQARNNKGYGPLSSEISFHTTPGLAHVSGSALFDSKGLTNSLLYIIITCVSGITLLIIIVVSVVVCRRRNGYLAADSGKSYKSAKGSLVKNKSATRDLVPPDLWIHHDQMELKTMEKGHNPESNMTVTPIQRNSQELCHEPLLNTLEKKKSAYLDSINDDLLPNADKCVVKCRPIRATPIKISLDHQKPLMNDTSVITCSSSGLNQNSYDLGTNSLGRPLYPRTQYNINRNPIIHDGHQLGEPPPPPQVAEISQCPGSSYETDNIVSDASHSVTFIPSVHENPEQSNSNTLSKKQSGHQHPLRSFTVPGAPSQSVPATPLSKHISLKSPAIVSSPHKKVVLRTPIESSAILQASSNLPQTSSKLCPSASSLLPKNDSTRSVNLQVSSGVQPSESTEHLNQEMANLEGLMKDLNAITASEFEC